MLGILGADLACPVDDQVASGFASAGMSGGHGMSGGSPQRPPRSPPRHRRSSASRTAIRPHIFLLSAGAAVFLKPINLRSTLNIAHFRSP